MEGFGSLATQCGETTAWTEADRLAALDRYVILDTERESRFEEIVRLASDICETPIAVVNFIADGRQWFKAETGIGARELPLDVSICRHAILRPGLFVVPDLAQDPRFAANPLVTAAGGLRFYAGALLETPEGLPLGTVCVLDTKPRPEGLAERQGRLLGSLARQVMTELELRRTVAQRDAEIAAARASREALAETSAVLQAIARGSRDIVFAKHPDGRLAFVNDTIARYLGHPAADLIGRDEFAFMSREDALAIRANDRRIMDRGEGETVEERAWGRVFVSTKAPWRGEDGELRGLVGIGHDITDRKAAEAALLEAQARLRTREADLARAQRLGRIGSWAWDAATDRAPGSEELSRIFGLDPAEPFPDFARQRGALYPVEEWERIQAAASETLRTGVGYELDVRAFRGDAPIWVTTRGEALRDADGRAVGLHGTVQDITERKLAEEERQLLVRELDHRVKNLFTIAEGMIALTARSARSPAEMARVLSGRLMALSRAHDLIRAAIPGDVGRNESVPFDELLAAVLEPHLPEEGERLRSGGPALRIGPGAATGLALVLHELATNALKYGALSRPEGRIAVGWQVEEGRMRLSWNERDGPVVVPPARQGFGSRLARMTVGGQLGGDIAHDWRAEGLRVTLTLPLDRLTA